MFNLLLGLSVTVRIPRILGPELLVPTLWMPLHCNQQTQMTVSKMPSGVRTTKTLLAGLWKMYLTEVQREDEGVCWDLKGDANDILVFTGVYSATVAAFIIESYKQLSPDSGVTTNTLLSQISQQLANISSGTPLASVAAQNSQPFRPTASAVRVNVLWFLSLVISLNCALSATL
ncbi:hypothetical protein EDB89DRAFT_2102785, partial [Lactarius sanguifluus]